MAAPAIASGLPQPTDKVLLDISGAIAQGNLPLRGDASQQGEVVAAHAQFDMAMLKKMPATTIETATPWFDGVHRLTGVRLADLLKAVGASGETIEAVALNDYMVEIPVGDAVSDDVIVAYAFDDQPMSVRDKGPLWVIYPLTGRPALNTPEIQSKMIWQLKAMTIQ
ncbi:MAG TPA: molybdopterin-dependent oxidoreductase [Dongiaceae bacterium]|nr:molybdopterin-dependent oxidoreductase [Dongiaceae bacterium]